MFVVSSKCFKYIIVQLLQMLNEILKVFNCHSAFSIDSRYMRLNYTLNLIIMSALLLVFEYSRCLRPRISCLQKREDNHVNPVFVAEFCWDHLLALKNNFTGTVTERIIFWNPCIHLNFNPKVSRQRFPGFFATLNCSTVQVLYSSLCPRYE